MAAQTRDELLRQIKREVFTHPREDEDRSGWEIAVDATLAAVLQAIGAPAVMPDRGDPNYAEGILEGITQARRAVESFQDPAATAARPPTWPPCFR